MWSRATRRASRIAQPLLFAVIATLLTVLVARPTIAQFTPFEAAIAEFDASVAAGVADDAAGCVSVAAFEGSRVIWSKGYGWADIERRIAATAETIGRTGSISKSFTAVLLLQLVERGILGLDDPVREHFPRDRPAARIGRPVTARSRSGCWRAIPRAWSASRLWRARRRARFTGGKTRFSTQSPHTSFKTPPLTEYSYSNIGFGILGLAASRAATVPFMELVERQILEPLGMASSAFVISSPELLRRLSVGYSRNRETGDVSAATATREHFGRGYKVPNGGLYSTVGDLAMFAAALLGEGPSEILSPASRAALFTPQPPADDYGLGFRVDRTDGKTMVGHGGSVAGYNASLQFDLESGIGIAMLRTTSYDPPVDELLMRLTATRP